MELDLSVGAEIEVATRGDVKALGGKLDMLGHRLRRPILDTLIPINPQPMPAAGAGLLRFNGPAPGEVWHIRTMAWFTDDDHTPVAGGYVATYIATDAAQLAGQLLTAGRAIPGDAQLPSDSAKIHAGEFLVMLFYGVAAGKALNGNARVEKWPAEWVERSRVP